MKLTYPNVGLPVIESNRQDVAQAAKPWLEFSPVTNITISASTPVSFKALLTYA